MRALAFTAILALGAVMAPAPAQAAAAIATPSDAPLNEYVLLNGINIRIDKIETVAKVDKRAIVAKAQLEGEGNGYIMVTASVQNPSASEDRQFGQNRFVFELADGSQIEETEPSAILALPGLSAAPTTLHPKQHVDVVFVFGGWNASPITKMFVHTTDNAATGKTNLRFQVRPGYAKALDPQ